MKIRLYKDSVRFRLSPSEVELLKDGSKITEAFSWGNFGKLSFELIPGDDIELAVDSDRSIWQIIWNSQLIKEWGISEDVGIYHDFINDGKKLLSVLIEKDFKCTGREGEEEKDRFPNPNKEVC